MKIFRAMKPTFSVRAIFFPAGLTEPCHPHFEAAQLRYARQETGVDVH